MTTATRAVRRMAWKTSRSAWSLSASFALVGVLLLALLPGNARAAELVMFEEAGCSWCRRWDKEVGVAYPKTDEGRRAPLRRLDISSARSSGLRLSGPVNVTPTFVLVDAGTEIGRITGYPGADFFWGLLGEMIARLSRSVPEMPRDARATSTEPARTALMGLLAEMRPLD
ncbi:MAG: thioredoxin family protein [Hyphomicrobiaceae bacterium]